MIQAEILKLVNRLGYQLIRSDVGFTAEDLADIRRVKAFTVTSNERVAGLNDAVSYLVKNKIPGDIVECGVWRGGSMMAAMHTLLKLGDTSRHFYLFDTFQGMAEPTERDVMFDGQLAKDLIDQDRRRKGAKYNWCAASVDDVQRNVASTGYPTSQVHLIKGKVEDTIPGDAPAAIALLRLDTDWYVSTMHEMKHLYPRLVPHGVLIVDDYGHWVGAKQAVDEYFGAQKFAPLLSRMDYTGRMLVKPAGV